MILLEKSLLVLEAGVVEGRKVFANILKYVRMGASSNFGNMFSVLGASVFVPYLPMAPIQILANNLLYDVSQTAIPTDAVDPEQVEKPRPWDIKQLTRFIVFIGPCSSIFDYTTYFMMLYVFNCWNISTPEAAARSASLFQTGWFVESLLTQTLIIHIIRTNKIPFLQSRSSWPLIGMSVVIMVTGIAIPFTPLGRYLGFTALPPLVLAAAGAHAPLLRAPDAVGQDVAAAEEVDLMGEDGHDHADHKHAVSGHTHSVGADADGRYLTVALLLRLEIELTGGERQPLLLRQNFLLEGAGHGILRVMTSVDGGHDGPGAAVRSRRFC